MPTQSVPRSALRRAWTAPSVAAWLAVSAGGGCYAGLHDGPDAAADGADETGADGGDGEGDGDGTSPDDPRLFFTCDDEQARLRGTSVARLRRLSSAELSHTLQALLGDDVYADAEIEPRISGLPSDVTVDAGDFALDPPVTLALALSSVAKRVAEVAAADPQWAGTHLAPCADAGPIDVACATSVAEGFGGRVWRRDLTAAEIDAYVDYFEQTGGGAEGLGFMVRRILQAPSLVFHIEEGDGEPVDGRVRLTAFEVASRLAYTTTDAPPDDALMAAARSGELDTIEGVRAHARRLLEGERARAKVMDFFRFYTRLTSVADPLPGAGARIGIDDTFGYGDEVKDEAFEFMSYVVESGGGFSELMGSTAAFPRTDDLATVFGTEVVDGAEPADAPTHPGLLHRPALLASGGARTSPILRGAHVRKLFLCDSLPLPNPEDVMNRQEEVGDIEGMPNRDRVDTLTDAPACLGCHAVVNPLGFTFEGYDQLGALRDEEAVLAEDGTVSATWPIDTAVSDLPLEAGGPISVADSIELADAMMHSYKARACIARRVFEYYQLREHDADLDGCVLHEQELQAHDGSLIDVFEAAVANEDILWKKAP